MLCPLQFAQALRGLETGLDGWDLPKGYKKLNKEQMLYKLRVPNPDRFVVLRQAFDEGLTVEEMFELTKVRTGRACDDLFKKLCARNGRQRAAENRAALRPLAAL